MYARWTAYPNRASNAEYTVTPSGGQDTVTMNQQANSGTWQLLGTYSSDAGDVQPLGRRERVRDRRCGDARIAGGGAMVSAN